MEHFGLYRGDASKIHDFLENPYHLKSEWMLQSRARKESFSPESLAKFERSLEGLESHKYKYGELFSGEKGSSNLTDDVVSLLQDYFKVNQFSREIRSGYEALGNPHIGSKIEDLVRGLTNPRHEKRSQFDIFEDCKAIVTRLEAVGTRGPRTRERLSDITENYLGRQLFLDRRYSGLGEEGTLEIAQKGDEMISSLLEYFGLSKADLPTIKSAFLKEEGISKESWELMKNNAQILG